jgi:hypothetical protein
LDNIIHVCQEDVSNDEEEIRLVIKTLQKELEDYDADLWGDLKKKSKSYIEHFREKSRVILEPEENLFFLHCPIGDIHLGHDGVDYERAEHDATLIGSCKYARAYNIGDSIDNFIKAKVIDAVISATTTPKQQLKLLTQYLEFFKGNLILMIGGNHDRWTKKVSGLDWLAPFTEKAKVIYSPDEFNVFFRYPSGVEYYFKLRHKYKYKSVYNITHTLKQMLRFANKIFDVGVTGHDHNVAMEQVPMYGEVRTFIKSGTYKVADPFTTEIGFPDGQPIFPCWATSPFEKKIIPFFYIEDGVDFVNMKNRELEGEKNESRESGVPGDNEELQEEDGNGEEVFFARS